MSVDVSEDGEVSLDIVSLTQMAQVGVNFVLACHLAGKSTREVLDALIAEASE